MDVMVLNNQIVSMRKKVKVAKIQLIRKLSKQCKSLKEKKGDKQDKFKRKAENVHRDILAVKNADKDEISKFALQNTKPINQLLGDGTCPPLTRILAKLSSLKVIDDDVKAFREKYVDWVYNMPVMMKRLGKGQEKNVMKQNIKMKKYENKEWFKKNSTEKKKKRFKTKNERIMPMSTREGKETSEKKMKCFKSKDETIMPMSTSEWNIEEINNPVKECLLQKSRAISREPMGDSDSVPETFKLSECQSDDGSSSSETSQREKPVAEEDIDSDKTNEAVNWKTSNPLAEVKRFFEYQTSTASKSSALATSSTSEDENEKTVKKSIKKTVDPFFMSGNSVYLAQDTQSIEKQQMFNKRRDDWKPMKWENNFRNTQKFPYFEQRNSKNVMKSSSKFNHPNKRKIDESCEKELHPSWIAKKQMKEKQGIIAFKGTKIKFND